METLQFTTRVLGKKAAKRLEDFEVTQTIRSESATICQAYFNGSIKRGDAIKVLLDDRMIGVATFLTLDQVRWHNLDIKDARRGGFDNLHELAYALKRAGHRFKGLEEYPFRRCLFPWAEAKGLASIVK